MVDDLVAKNKILNAMCHKRGGTISTAFLAFLSK